MTENRNKNIVTLCAYISRRCRSLKEVCQVPTEHQYFGGSNHSQSLRCDGDIFAVLEVLNEYVAVVLGATGDLGIEDSLVARQILVAISLFHVNKQFSQTELGVL